LSVVTACDSRGNSGPVFAAIAIAAVATRASAGEVLLARGGTLPEARASR
jgi:hypothetical protein